MKAEKLVLPPIFVNPQYVGELLGTKPSHLRCLVVDRGE